MSISIMPWLLLWAVVTTGVLALFVWRVLVVKDETIRIGVGDERVGQAEAKLTRKLARIDFWGKTLTVASAALVLVVGVVWLYNALP